MEGFGFIDLYVRADGIVKSVMILLAVSSLASWVIIVEKAISYYLVKRDCEEFLKRFWSDDPIEKTYEDVKSTRWPVGMTAIFLAGMSEWIRSQRPDANFSRQGIKERINRVMDVQLHREGENLRTRLIILATIGSAGPFVGLFGTVWGIMGSFSAIAASKNTSLETVAPGLAEALFATAIGLVAAIPAVVAYNVLIDQASQLSAKLSQFADEFWAIVSRNIDKDPTSANKVQR